MKATQIKRMSSTLKAEAVTAANNLWIDGYTISSDLKTIESEDCFSQMMYFRNGEEVIAVPDFYISEDCVSFIGSKNGEYTLFNETLYVGFHIVEPVS